MKVLWDCEAEDLNQYPQHVIDNCRQWLRDHGGDPDWTARVRVIADGDGMLLIDRIRSNGWPIIFTEIVPLKRMPPYPLAFGVKE